MTLDEIEQQLTNLETLILLLKEAKTEREKLHQAVDAVADSLAELERKLR